MAARTAIIVNDAHRDQLMAPQIINNNYIAHISISDKNLNGKRAVDDVHNFSQLSIRVYINY